MFWFKLDTFADIWSTTQIQIELGLQMVVLGYTPSVEEQSRGEEINNKMSVL